MVMARVVLEHLEKVYPNGVRAVRDLSLDVVDGELMVLLGPSGCGKTTTLRLIAGLDEPTRGTIALGGRTIDRLPPKDRDLAMVFQTPALYPHLTVLENLAFSLRMRGVPRKAIRHNVLRTARLLGIDDLLDRKPRQLSGGQGQRVALGRALVRRPACYLFDEPLSSLDAPLRGQLRSELKRFHQRLGITTLYVTHDQEEAMALAGRIAVLCDGELQQVGPPREVYDRPANRFVAGFVGSPPMNFVDGTLVGEEDRLWFDTGRWRLAMAPEGLAAHAGRHAVLGIRPEDLRLAGPREMADGALRAEVALVEPLGDRTWVHLEVEGGFRLVARTDPRHAPACGAALGVQIPLDRAHWFEAGETGQRIA
jgi:multiple sugar transport system ATP-binding protein